MIVRKRTSGAAQAGTTGRLTPPDLAEVTVLIPVAIKPQLDFYVPPLPPQYSTAGGGVT